MERLTDVRQDLMLLTYVIPVSLTENLEIAFLCLCCQDIDSISLMSSHLSAGNKYADSILTVPTTASGVNFNPGMDK